MTLNPHEPLFQQQNLSRLFSLYRSELLTAMDGQDSTDTVLWKLTSLKFVFDTARFSTQLDIAAKDPRTDYTSPLYRKQRHDCTFFVQFYPYGLDSAPGTHASIMFALFPGEYDGLLTWLFPKLIHLAARDQLDPHYNWTNTLETPEKLFF